MIVDRHNELAAMYIRLIAVRGSDSMDCIFFPDIPVLSYFSSLFFGFVLILNKSIYIIRVLAVIGFYNCKF